VTIAVEIDVNRGPTALRRGGRRARRWLLAVAMTLLLGGSARADDDGKLPRWQVSAAPLYAFIVLEGQGEPKGAGGTLQLGYALSDSFTVEAWFLWTVHDVAPTEESAGGTFHVGNAALGIGYALDIGRFVPTLEAGVGVLHRRFGDQAATDLGVRVGLRIDARVLDWLIVGFAVRYHGFLTSPTELPVHVEAGPRVGFCWGRTGD